MALSTAANARQRLVLQQKLYAAENSLGACRFHVRLTDEGLPRMPEGGREGRSAEKKGAVEAERKELAALVAPHEAAFAQARKTLSDCDKRGAALEEEVLQCPAARAAGSEALRALSGLTHQARMDALVLTAQTDVDVRDALIGEQQSVIADLWGVLEAAGISQQRALELAKQNGSITRELGWGEAGDGGGSGGGGDSEEGGPVAANPKLPPTRVVWGDPAISPTKRGSKHSLPSALLRLTGKATAAQFEWVQNRAMALPKFTALQAGEETATELAATALVRIHNIVVHLTSVGFESTPHQPAGTGETLGLR
jgi:hypothetical protein